MQYLKHLTLFSIAAALTALPLRAGDDDTAAYYKAHLEEYTGKSIDVDVMALRALPLNVGDDFFVFAVWTWNDDSNSAGGGIAVVAPTDKKEAILRKYGTSTEWDGRRDPDTKSLRGILQSAPKGEDKASDIPYIDMTDGAFKPNGQFAKDIEVPERPARH